MFPFLGPDRDDQHGSMDDDDDDDDASVSDRSSRGSASMKPTTNVRWDYRVMHPPGEARKFMRSFLFHVDKSHRSSKSRNKSILLLSLSISSSACRTIGECFSLLRISSFDEFF